MSMRPSPVAGGASKTQVDVHVECDVVMAYDSGVAAWVFDPHLWGVCGQGRSETEALLDLKEKLPEAAELRVVERVLGDEGAFKRDHVPATEHDVASTLAILSTARAELLDLLHEVPGSGLEQTIPQHAHFAKWTSIRDRAWHIADTESRYYLPSLGLAAKPRASELMTELRESADHVKTVLHGMSRTLRRETHGEVWTSTKLLRRLAWHEPGEVAVIRAALG